MNIFSTKQIFSGSINILYKPDNLKELLYVIVVSSKKQYEKVSSVESCNGRCCDICQNFFIIKNYIFSYIKVLFC